MSQTLKIALSLLILYGGLAAGYLARRWRPALPEASPRIMRTTLLFLDCPLTVLIFWLLSPSQRAGVWQLPVLGFVLAALLVGVGIAAARLQRLERPAEGAFVLGASMSNIGFSFGGLLCLVILGVDGLTLSGIYTMYFTPFTFLVMFQVAAWYSAAPTAATARTMIAGFTKDPARWVPVLAMLLGIAANLLAPRPPAWMAHLVAAAVLLATGLYCFAIGAAVRLGRIRDHLRACLAMSVVKFLIAPLIALGLAMLFDLTPVQRQVVFVESATPMAIFAVVLAGLTGLNRDLANSCWIFTTVAALPVVLPVYLVVTRWIGGGA